jgi:hypothetical protein
LLARLLKLRLLARLLKLRLLARLLKLRLLARLLKLRLLDLGKYRRRQQGSGGNHSHPSDGSTLGASPAFLVDHFGVFVRLCHSIILRHFWFLDLANPIMRIASIVSFRFANKQLTSLEWLSSWSTVPSVIVDTVRLPLLPQCAALGCFWQTQNRAHGHSRCHSYCGQVAYRHRLAEGHLPERDGERTGEFGPYLVAAHSDR